MDIIFDIETDGLLRADGDKPEGSVVHCLVWKDEGDDVVHDAVGHEAIIKALEWWGKVEYRLVGHNIQGFDLPFLKKVFGWEPSHNARIYDTLIAARVAFPDIIKADYQAKDKGKDFPKELMGRHSLEAWGYRLGVHKGAKPDFKEFSQEMLDYCIQDVKATAALYDWLQKKEIPEEALDLEHKFAAVLDRQMARGVCFDVPAATALYGDLKQQQSVLIESLKDAFPPLVKTKQLKTKVKEEIIPFNPTSRAQIARGFKTKYGWKATKLTPSGQPQVDEEVLAELDYPEAKPLLELMDLSKQIGQLAEGNQALLKSVQADGRIYGYINHNGAVSGRCIHSRPNLGQIPRGGAFRRLFVPRPGWTLVGADASGLELRCLAHYMAKYDKGAYRDILLKGDIHTANQEAAGLETRDQAKTFIYAFLYGAGPEKLGSIVGGGRKEGLALRKRFLSKLPALKYLSDAVQSRAEQTGFLLSLERRKVRVRSKHSALNTLLQSAGAILMKKAVVLLDDAIAATGTLAHQVLMVHDEVQYEAEPEAAERVGLMAVESIKEAGHLFNLRCPLAGEYKIGSSWAETH